MSCGPFAVLTGRRCVRTERILRIAHALVGISSWWTPCCGTDAVFSRDIFFEKAILGASPHAGRCVVGWALCSQGKYFSNRRSFGHLLMMDAVLWGGRGVLKGSISLEIDTPWGISIWLTLCCGTYAAYSQGSCVLKGNICLIDTPWGISSLRTLCCQSYAVFSRGVFFE